MNTYGIHYNDARGHRRYTEFHSSLSHTELLVEVNRATLRDSDVTLTDTEGIALSVSSRNIRSIGEV